MAFNFTAHWMKGSHNNGPNALSQNPITDPTNEDTLAEFDIHSQPEVSTAEIWAITDTNLGNMQLKDLKHYADQDQE